MIKEAEDELMNVLGWLCTDMASTAHLNRMKVALGRTDTEPPIGLDGQPAYPGDVPPPATIAPEPATPEEATAPVEEPAHEPEAPAEEPAVA